MPGRLLSSAWAAALVVGTSAAVLVLEVLVVRLVAPYVGLTLETYTAAIGVALAAIAAGAATGGRLADTLDPRSWLGPATALGGVLVLLARPLVLLLGDDFRGTGPGGTLVLVTVAVGPAALVLSAVPPGVVKLRLRALAETGVTVGRLSALGTLGGLAGTFLTGFVLLSALPVSRLLLVTGLLLVGGGVAAAVLLPRAAPGAGVAALTVAAVLGTVGLVSVDSPCDVETANYCARVEDDPQRPTGRVLVLDGLRHSYVDLADAAHLEFSYTQRFGAVLASQPPGPLDVLHLGLGGGTMPRYLEAVRPGSTSVVLEVDPQLPELGREHLGLRTGPDLQVVVGDARTEVRDQPRAAFDVVNVIDHPPLAFASAYAATLLAAFAHVRVLAPPAVLAGTEGGNLVLAASDERERLEPVEDAREAATLAGEAAVLTDDFAPVDQLLTPYGRATG